MNYDKTSTKKRMKKVDSKGSKIKNKASLTAVKVVLAALGIVLIIGVSAVIGVARGIIDSAPDISQVDVIPTGYSTTVLANDGQEIATLVGSGANREYVTLDQIPLHMQQAFVAIEDERFYEHNGIDLYSIARAGVATVKGFITGDGGMQGGSTITQQLIKNNVLTSWTGETTFIEKLQRKIQEQYLAIKLEKQVQDKDWILENYLNTINLGSNTLGVQAASNKYFGKPVSELTLSESAVIAGITKNPYGYDPIRFPEVNAERRELVLDAMLRVGFIDQDEYDEAMADPVYDRISSYNADTTTSYNTYFVDALIEDLLDDLIEKKGYSENDAYKLIYQGGLTIHSTQDMAIQTIADEEANDPDNYPMKDKYSFFLSFAVKKADGTTKTYTHQTMQAYYKKVNNNPEYSINYASEEACYEAIREYEQDVLEAGDTLVEDSESVVITLQPQVALTIMDQSTGEVKALVGGRGDKVGNRTWNRATDTARQPGSTFKIIGCYAAALDAGGLTLASVQDDAPFTMEEKEFNNADDSFHGLTTLREGIINSYNITTLKTLYQIGASMGYDYALKFGFTTLTEDDRNLSLALGGLTHGVKNLELTAAYAAIANKGEYIEPSFYTKVYDHDGNLLLDNTSPDHHTVISEETAWLLTDAMRDVMTEGTGGRAYFGATMDQAGKTGTTTSNRDTLFAGFTPYYTCVVWGGYDDNSMQNGSNCVYSRNIWREVMSRVHTDLPYKEFEQPSEITTVMVCNDSGYLPLPGVCEFALKGNSVYAEFFAAGTEPVTTCDHHAVFNVCATSGLIANSNCPSVYPIIYIVGADPNTEDFPYIASEIFLANTCGHQPEPEKAPEPTPAPSTPSTPPASSGGSSSGGSNSGGSSGSGSTGGSTDSGNTGGGTTPDPGTGEGTTPDSGNTSDPGAGANLDPDTP